MAAEESLSLQDRRLATRRRAEPAEQEHASAGCSGKIFLAGRRTRRRRRFRCGCSSTKLRGISLDDV